MSHPARIRRDRFTVHSVKAAVAGVSAAVLVTASATAARAQRLIERTPNLPNAVVAMPGMLEASLTNRFARDVGRAGSPGGSGLSATSTFDLALGLPFLLPLEWSPGLRYSPATFAVRRDELELYERLGVLRQATAAPLDVVVTGAYNFRARSIDAEAVLARRIGPLRVMGVGRLLSSPGSDGDPDDDGARFALAAGGVLHVNARSSPVTIAGDVATLTNRRTGESVAWSGAVATGLPHTPLSISLHATNVRTTTLRGTSVGGRRTRWGLEVNAPVEFVGFLLGMYTSRERAQRAVRQVGDIVPAGPPATVTVRIRGYLYAPSVLRVRAGDVVEWINEDDVVHTVTSENAAFDSRAIEPGERWRARFTQRGVYPYYCGPHPFMKGVVVVR